MIIRTAARFGAIALTAALVLAATVSGPAPAVAGPDPAPAVLKVMPLGDSITRGSGSADSRVGNRTGAATSSGYRIDLQNRLEAAGLNVDFVGSQQAGPAGTDTDHEGHSGWRIDQLAANVDDWLATYQPDAILLHAGTNDMAQNRNVDITADRLSALIDQIRAARPYAEIFVQQLVQGHVEPYRSRIAAYDERIPGIVAGKDAGVHLVDQSSIGGLSVFDNLHPNDDGYAKMAYNLYRAMAGVYQGTTVWPAGTDPYAATSATLCFQINTADRDWHAECSPWSLRDVITTVAGRTVVTAEWQRLGTATETHSVYVKAYYTTKKVAGTAQVWVKGRFVTRLVEGNPTRVWVKPHYETRKVTRNVKVLVEPHYETRTRTVTTWLSDDPYLANVRS